MAYDTQDITFQAVMAFREAHTNEEGKLVIDNRDARALADLVKSWQIAQDRVAFHRRVPSPGALGPADREPKRRAKRVNYGAWPTPAAAPSVMRDGDATTTQASSSESASSSSNPPP